MKKYLAIFIIAIAGLVGCSQPVPNDKLDYVGEWQSPEMYLLILADGSVAYERLKDGGKVSVNGPMKGFKGNDFEVGIGLLATTFEVSQPPYLENGKWYMVVDGVKLKKSLEEL
tara:strand:- start:76 stop:417 length:342 start_codon:yes stop_codon:yes gene_type:complete